MKNSINLVFNNPEEAFNYLLDNEIQFSIITTISVFCSLNQRQLSHIINKPEPTIYRHAKKLLDIGFLVVDSVKSSSNRGKFYKFSQDYEKLMIQAEKKYENWEDDRVEYVKELKKSLENKELSNLNSKIIKRFLNIFSSGIAFKQLDRERFFTSNLQNSIINTIKMHNKRLQEELKESEVHDLDVLRAHISLHTILMKTYKTEHYIKLYEIITNYFKQLKDLKESIEEEIKEEKIPEEKMVIQYLSSFGGSIDANYFD